MLFFVRSDYFSELALHRLLCTHACEGKLDHTEWVLVLSGWGGSGQDRLVGFCMTQMKSSRSLCLVRVFPRLRRRRVSVDGADDDRSIDRSSLSHTRVGRAGVRRLEGARNDRHVEGFLFLFAKRFVQRSKKGYCEWYLEG